MAALVTQTLVTGAVTLFDASCNANFQSVLCNTNFSLQLCRRQIMKADGGEPPQAYTYASKGNIRIYKIWVK